MATLGFGSGGGGKVGGFGQQSGTTKKAVFGSPTPKKVVPMSGPFVPPPMPTSAPTPVPAVIRESVPLTATNTAAPDPLLQSAIKTFQERANADNTKRATDKVFSAAKGGAAGLNNDLDAQMARRGIGGSGLDARARTQVSEAAARAAAGGAANIQLGQQDRLDRLAQVGAGIAKMPADLALQQQGLGIQQMSLQNQSQNQQAQLAMQQQAQQQQMQQQQMQNWLALMNAGFF